MVFSNPQASLLEKLNLTVDQLDYKYIENCVNVKQVERILRVLRSGEEGVFPDLIKFCEARLQQLDPSNKYLLSAKGIMNFSDLPLEEKENILGDLETWSRDYSKRTPQNTSRELYDIPPVRGHKISDKQQQIDSDKGKQENNETKQKICKPRSYEEWDKFDVDGEIEKLESTDEIEKTGNETEEKDTLNKSLPVNGLSSAEREYIANLERIKGNEAFKAQDYEEAVLYYSRSLSIFRTATTLNNRAQAYLKLKNYLEAVIDCNEVMSMEPNNIKALYRRGIAHKEAQMLDLAVLDFEIILKIEPDNKSAIDQLREIESSILQKPKDKKKVVIEELESEIHHNDETEEMTFDSKNGEKSTRLTIEEISETPNEVLDEICNWCVSGDDTRPLSKNTREMLNIFKNSNTIVSKSEPILVEEAQNQQPLRNSKSLNINTLKIQKNLTKEDNLKADFKNIEIQNALAEESKIKKENNSESWIKEKASNSSIEIEEMYSEIIKQSDKENTTKDMEGNIENNYSMVEYNNGDNHLITKSIKLNRVTPFEFLQMWLSNNCNSNSNNGAACLLAVKPQELPKFLTNKLDGPLLSSLLKAIKNLFNTGKQKESLEYLNYLLEVPRIKLTALFLSTDEKKDIEDHLIIVENQLGENLDHARRILSIN